MSKPDFYKLGYDAIIQNPRNFEAFEDALKLARGMNSSPDEAEYNVCVGAMEAEMEKKDDIRELTEVTVLMIIKALQRNWRPNDIYIIFNGFYHALFYDNLIGALILINYTPSDLHEIKKYINTLIFSASRQRNTAPSKNTIAEFTNLTRVVIAKLKKVNPEAEAEEPKRKALLDLVETTIRFIKIARGSSLQFLNIILDVLVSNVILPLPPESGDDPLKIARERWEKIRMTKSLVMSRLPKVITDEINTFGLQKFCTKCHGAVL